MDSGLAVIREVELAGAQGETVPPGSMVEGDGPHSTLDLMRGPVGLPSHLHVTPYGAPSLKTQPFSESEHFGS